METPEQKSLREALATNEAELAETRAALAASKTLLEDHQRAAERARLAMDRTLPVLKSAIGARVAALLAQETPSRDVTDAISFGQSYLLRIETDPPKGLSQLSAMVAFCGVEASDGSVSLAA